MPSIPTTNLKLALLIDADNTPADIISQLFAEIAKYGIPNIKRIYGNWTSNQLSSWKTKLLEYSIQPIQQFAYTTGKNSTDSCLIIDAMDLLYNHSYLEGFCIVPSDSDFTRLAARLRESGKKVFGFGKQTTPDAFKAACDRFIYIEILKTQIESAETKQTQASNNKTTNKITIAENKALIKQIKSIFANISDEEGKVSLSLMRSHLDKILNDFDPRNYGFTKFSNFIEATKLFELSNRNTLIKLKTQSKKQNELKQQVLTAFKNTANTKQIAYMSALKANLNFDPKDYGYNKFSLFIKSLGIFDIIDNTKIKLKDN